MIKMKLYKQQKNLKHNQKYLFINNYDILINFDIIISKNMITQSKILKKIIVRNNKDQLKSFRIGKRIKNSNI